MKINFDLIDMNSIEVEGIDTKDYPDFVDAFISHAAYKDGTFLTDEELQNINENEGSFVYDCVLSHVF